jgi:hypothetical protein
MASTELTRTPSSTTNRKTYTFSAWVKRNKISSGYPRIFAYDYADTDRFEFFFYNTDEIQIEHVNNNSVDIDIHTTRKFRDTNGWYHIVLAVDTTQSTVTDRVKLYINGVQETSFTNAAGSSPTYPPQDTNTIVNYASGSKFFIGETGYSSGNQNFDGLMSHIHFVDGAALAPTVFGSTDSTTGEWKINTNPSYTVGTNGFFILKDGNSVTDQSANSNNFTVAGGTLTKTEDNPSNVFATLNPLDTVSTLSNGNTKVVGNTSGYFCGATNVGAKTGKYYCEVKFAAESSSNQGNIAIQSTSNVRECSRRNYHSNQVGASFPNVLIEMDGSVYVDSGNAISGNWGAFAVGDIVMIAMDLDNSKVYFGKNGTWGNSGDPTSGSTGTGAAPISANTEEWFFGCGDRGTSTTATYEWNFGNGYFGTTAVSSAGTNASNIGIFEYNVPTGYTALSTKGLNE